MARAFISIGSNVDPESNVRAALDALGRELTIVAASTFYRTQPLGPVGQPAFINGVVEIRTHLRPRRPFLAAALHELAPDLRLPDTAEPVAGIAARLGRFGMR
jgi:2-amino-4-hydroxy-6-hydroxymethyldihydropteridine diphosphokinase